MRKILFFLSVLCNTPRLLLLLTLLIALMYGSLNKGKQMNAVRGKDIL